MFQQLSLSVVSIFWWDGFVSPGKYAAIWSHQESVANKEHGFAQCSDSLMSLLVQDVRSGRVDSPFEITQQGSTTSISELIRGLLQWVKQFSHSLSLLHNRHSTKANVRTSPIILLGSKNIPHTEVLHEVETCGNIKQ